MGKPNDNGVSIRIGTLEDAPVIANFTRQIALETEDVKLDPQVVLSGVQNGMSAGKYGFYVVAQDKSQIVGCLMITYEWSDWRDGVQWWLQSVYVDPNHRATGVFKKLFTFVVDRANQESNVCGIRLYVDKSNSTALATYESLGLTSTNYLMYEMPVIK